VYIHQNVGFRPIEADDLEPLRALHNDMTTLLQLGTVDLVSSDEQVEWWKGLSKNRTEKRYSVVELGSGKVIGMVRIQNIDSVNAHCEVGLDIVPTHRGKGYGTSSYRMVLEYLFLHYNMHMVYLRVAEFNERAIRLYEQLGFVETGRFTEYLFRNGKFWDYILMTMTRDRYMQLHAGAGGSGR